MIACQARNSDGDERDSAVGERMIGSCLPELQKRAIDYDLVMECDGKHE